MDFTLKMYCWAFERVFRWKFKCQLTGEKFYLHSLGNVHPHKAYQPVRLELGIERNLQAFVSSIPAGIELTKACKFLSIPNSNRTGWYAL